MELANETKDGFVHDANSDEWRLVCLKKFEWVAELYKARGGAITPQQLAVLSDLAQRQEEETDFYLLSKERYGSRFKYASERSLSSVVYHGYNWMELAIKLDFERFMRLFNFQQKNTDSLKAQLALCGKYLNSISVRALNSAKDKKDASPVGEWLELVIRLCPNLTSLTLLGDTQFKLDGEYFQAIAQAKSKTIKHLAFHAIGSSQQQVYAFSASIIPDKAFLNMLLSYPDLTSLSISNFCLNKVGMQMVAGGKQSKLEELSLT